MPNSATIKSPMSSPMEYMVIPKSCGLSHLSDLPCVMKMSITLIPISTIFMIWLSVLAIMSSTLHLCYTMQWSYSFTLVS